jgi:hypothetical protein
MPPIRGDRKKGKGRLELLRLGPGRRFVPGVTAGICRRPYDRPKAETHPPNGSINVCLVNFPNTAVSGEFWRFVSLLLSADQFRVPLDYALPTGRVFVLL